MTSRGARPLLAALLVLALGAPPAQAIVGGTAAPQGKYPSVARIIIAGSFECTGTLIAPGWVLTAGHCGSLTGSAEVASPVAFPPAAFDVTVGTVDGGGKGGERLTVASVVIPPNYLATSGYDTSLLHLAARARTQPTPVAGVGFEALWKPGVLETITGFGTTASGGEVPAVQQEAKVPVVSDSACAKAYDSFEPGTQLCAGYDEGGTDSCQGDSGGPLLATTGDGVRYVVGATSYGSGCGMPHTPGVYARVSDRLLREFIRSQAPDAVRDAPAGAVTTPAETYDPVTKKTSPGTPGQGAPASGAASGGRATAANGFVTSLAIDRTSLRTLRSRGARVRLRCSAACSATLVLRADAASAKRLGSRGPTLATARLKRSAAGRSTVRLRLSRSVAARLARAPRASFSVRGVVRGPGAARLTVRRAVKIG